MSTGVKFDQNSHFAFGKNWADYSQTITDTDIQSAKSQLQHLLGLDSLEGKTFLDVGCGSGIHALAALQLGSESLYAIDIDPDSADTTRTVLGKYWNKANYIVEQRNIFDIDADSFPHYDIVYSWGVLHHTGDMWDAIDKAANLVKGNGFLAIALYRKTGLCRFWQWEKKFYTHSAAPVQKLLVWLFIGMKMTRDLLRMKNPLRKVRGHSEKKRGMKWYFDIVDWLGGYPYESASPEEVQAFLTRRGFQMKHSFKTRKRLGVFGTGNAEYLFVKK